MEKQNVVKESVKMCEGCLCADHCRNCTYFDTSRPESSGSRYYKCALRGCYVRGDECACSSFARG